MLESPQVFPFEQFLKRYLRNLSDPQIIYLVAQEYDSAVAFGSLCISTPLHHTAPVAEIIELVTDEKHRGQGAGTMLLNAMVHMARDRGCCSLEVTSNHVRKRAHKFYFRHGFKQTHLKLTINMHDIV
jgi:PhnO protein